MFGHEHIHGHRLMQSSAIGIPKIRLLNSRPNLYHSPAHPDRVIPQVAETGFPLAKGYFVDLERQEPDL